VILKKLSWYARVVITKLQNKKKIESLARNVLNIRYKFTIEKNINKLIQYYKDISGE